MYQSVPPELPGAKSPAKEYTWRDQLLQLHMLQKMTISDSSERRGHWSCEGSFPQNIGMQVRKLGKRRFSRGVGGWERGLSKE